MKLEELKKIATILHTIFCGRQHEMKMENFDSSSEKCGFYIETSIDRCWELAEHKDWLAQAECFIQLCHPLSPIEIIQDLIEAHKTAMKIKSVNPKLMEYIKIIFR